MTGQIPINHHRPGRKVGRAEGSVEVWAQLATVIDDLRELHPTFRRTTIERLVIRTVRELGDVSPAEVRAAADAQLAYAEEVDAGANVRRSG